MDKFYYFLKINLSSMKFIEKFTTPDMKKLNWYMYDCFVNVWQAFGRSAAKRPKRSVWKATTAQRAIRQTAIWSTRRPSSPTTSPTTRRRSRSSETTWRPQSRSSSWRSGQRSSWRGTTRGCRRRLRNSRPNIWSVERHLFIFLVSN